MSFAALFLCTFLYTLGAMLVGLGLGVMGLALVLDGGALPQEVGAVLAPWPRLGGSIPHAPASSFALTGVASDSPPRMAAAELRPDSAGATKGPDSEARAARPGLATCGPLFYEVSR